MSNATILIHGYGFDQRTWLPVEIAFDKHETILFSLPGFGSAAPQEAYTIAGLAKIYWESIDPINHPMVHLAGHSMGGYVCIEMAAQQPSRVASLALIHSHVFEDSVEKKSQRTNTMGDIKAHGRNSLVQKMIPSMFGDTQDYTILINALVDRGVSYDDLTWYYGTQAMRDRNDHVETLRTLKVPVLMVGGNNDKAVPPEVMYKQSHLPAHNTLHMYDGVGHMSMYEKTSQLICDVISFYKLFQAK